MSTNFFQINIIFPGGCLVIFKPIAVIFKPIAATITTLPVNFYWLYINSALF